MTRRPYCTCCGHPRTILGCGGPLCNCRLREMEQRNLILSRNIGIHFDNTLRIYDEEEGTMGYRDGDQGASAVEYGLLVAALAAVIAATVFALGGVVRQAFDTTCSAVGGHATSGGVDPACGGPTTTPTDTTTEAPVDPNG